MKKQEIIDITALRYAEKVKKVNKPIMDAWKNGFYHCDTFLGIKYQLQEYEKKCQSFIDDEDMDIGYSDMRGSAITRRQNASKKAKDIISKIQDLRKAIDEIEEYRTL